MSTEAKSTDVELDWLYGLYRDGVHLDELSLNKLRKYGYITQEDKRPEEKEVAEDDVSFLEDYDPERAVAPGKGDFDELPFELNFKSPIDKEQWLPGSVTEHTNAFVNWIDSINSGFQNMVRYEPFLRYCQQAQEWLEEQDYFADKTTRSEKVEFCHREFDRCYENSLYFLDKYLWVKEGSSEGGWMKYRSKPVHKVVAFLIDCGYSFMMGKPRQIAATTTIGGISIARTLFNKNFFLKFIAQNETKADEIFGDKMKSPFYELDGWMKPTVTNDSHKELSFGRKKKKKGESAGHSSTIKVQPPTVDAINGGAPDFVGVDEAGYNHVLGKMIKEARPTLFKEDPLTGKLTLTRQIVIWGTGGEMDKAGKAYEEEFMSLYDSWQKGATSKGLIPLFFDWTTRPGITRDFYNKEYYEYVGGSKGDRTSMMSQEERIVQFRQHYPSTIEDMFLTGQKTLIPISKINQRLADIKSIPHEKRPVHGYFEPIYDHSREEHDDSELPFKVKGARFIPTEDGDPRASAIVYIRPQDGWRNRYVQGTDPIQSDNGYSRMASVVFDRKLMTVAAAVNYRNANHKETFLQNLLLGLWYDPERPTQGVPELIESNIGMAYRDYKDSKGFHRSLMFRTQLPIMFQGGQNIEGMSNTGQRKKAMVDKLYEFFHYYGDRIQIPEIWVQLRTFICDFTERGEEKWGVTDHRKYRDDLVDACGMAYIAHLSLDMYEPMQVDENVPQFKRKYRLVRGGNGKLTRVPVTHKQYA